MPVQNYLESGKAQLIQFLMSYTECWLSVFLTLTHPKIGSQLKFYPNLTFWKVKTRLNLNLNQT